MNESLKSFASYLCVAFVLALTLSCSTTPSSKVASTPKFRALANQVASIMNNTSATEIEVAATNKDMGFGGIQKALIHTRTRFYTTNAEITNRGILKFVYHKVESKTFDSTADPNPQLVGTHTYDCSDSFECEVPLAKLNKASGYFIPGQYRPPKFQKFDGIALETLQRSTDVCLNSVGEKNIKRIFRRKDGKIISRDPTDYQPCAAFGDDASAGNFAEMLNKLIEMAKADARN